VTISLSTKTILTASGYEKVTAWKAVQLCNISLRQWPRKTSALTHCRADAIRQPMKTSFVITGICIIG
jgi:hypothetical protein